MVDDERRPNDCLEDADYSSHERRRMLNIVKSGSDQSGKWGQSPLFSKNSGVILTLAVPFMRTSGRVLYSEPVKNWYSWGSPIGLGFWLIACGLFFVLLHYAGLLP